MTKIHNFEWRVSPSPVPYPEALAEMERRIALIEKGEAPELFWLLEHPPTYTAGTSAAKEELLDAGNIPVFETGRGGRYTYHGPGQRVIYALCDLRKRDRDLRAHVWRLEEWVIRTLGGFGIKGERREGRIGIWVTSNTEAGRAPLPLAGGAGGGLVPTSHTLTGPPLTPPASGRGTPPRSSQLISSTSTSEEKIAAIGVRVRRWIAYHGLALNVDPDLAPYKGIVPCGIAEHGVTSMRKLGVKATMQEVDEEFRKQAKGIFSNEAH